MKQGENIQTFQNLNDYQSFLMTFDGGSHPKNPGDVSCSGWTIESNGVLIAKGAHWIRMDNATNNFAEYCGVGFGLKFLIDNKWYGENLNLLIQGDSQLVVKQLSGEWRIKDARLKKLADRIFRQFEELGLAPHDVPETLIEDSRPPNGTWKTNWVQRELNSVADGLTHEAWQLYQKS